MKMEEIRKMSEKDINKKSEEDKTELFNLRFAAASGSLEKPHRVAMLRHEVARLKTVLKERELEGLKK